MGDGPPYRSLAANSVSTRSRVVAGEPQCENPSLSGPTEEIVSAFRLCGRVIELSSLVKVCAKKVLLDSGAIGTFVSDAMVTAFKLKA